MKNLMCWRFIFVMVSMTAATGRPIQSASLNRQPIDDVTEAIELLRLALQEPKLSDDDRETAIYCLFRHGHFDEAETQFNLISHTILADTDIPFPYMLARWSKNYEQLESFIARPTLDIPETRRRYVMDQVKSFRVNKSIKEKNVDAAIAIAKSLSVQPAHLMPDTNTNSASSEYLLMSIWSQIIGLQLELQQGQQALESLKQFRHEKDRRRLGRHLEERLGGLESQAIRDQLQVQFGEATKRGVVRRIKTSQFDTAIKDCDWQTSETLLADVFDSPEKDINRVTRLILAYQDHQETERADRWLDRVFQIRFERRTGDAKMLKAMLAANRFEEALQYFGPLSPIHIPRQTTPPNKRQQPLIQLAVSIARDSDLEKAHTVANSILNPYWRSVALADLAKAIASVHPTQAAEWEQLAQQTMLEIEDPVQRDNLLVRNLDFLNLEFESERVDEIVALIASPKKKAELLSRILTSAIKRDDLPEEDFQRRVDQISAFDPARLEDVFARCISQEDLRYAVIFAMKIRDDTDPAYLSWPWLRLDSFFEYATDKITLEQICSIFDNQLSKHRGCVMASCLRHASGPRRWEVLQAALDRYSDTDANLSLHNQVVEALIEKGDINTLREILDRPMPNWQLLNDHPVTNAWSYELARKLAKKIGSAEMLEFAKSLEQPKIKGIAGTEAMIELANKDSFQKAADTCRELTDSELRAHVIVRLVKWHLAPAGIR